MLKWIILACSNLILQWINVIKTHVLASSTEAGGASQTDATINGSSGIITSPGYPEKYPNNANCTWTLRTGNVKATVSLNFFDFNITKYNYSSRCDDFLLVKPQMNYYQWSNS